jgi:putative oxidoreductase
LRYLDRMQPLALVALRLTLGIIFIGHSSHKVYGHLHDYASFIGGLGVPAWLGYVAAFTEFLGGILLILGSLTRVAAFALFIDMIVAIAKVTGSTDSWAMAATNFLSPWRRLRSH